MAQTYVPRARAIRTAPLAERRAILKCHNDLLADAYRTLIQALRKIDGARNFAKRNGLIEQAEAMFDLHVSVGYRAYIFEHLLEDLENASANGDGSLSRNFIKYKAKLARPM